MKRVVAAPNLALATLWADQLCATGVEARVMRAWAGSIAGEIPPDQALPEIWVLDDDRLEDARRLLDAWQHLPDRHWRCTACGEAVDGPFDQCWNCGAPMPAHAAVP